MKGHIEKRVGKNGEVTWTARLRVPDPATGVIRHKRLSARTKAELTSLIAKTIAEVEGGAYVEPTKVTVREHLTGWLEAVEATVRPSTYVRYRDVVTKHLIPALGNLPLARLTSAHIQRFYAKQLTAGRAPGTVALYHGVLHRSLALAVRWRLILRNPCEAVEAPRPTPPEMRTWTAHQAQAFLAGTADDELHALWRLALMTGMRRGELLALRWADVDLGRGALAVRRTLARGKEGLRVNEPKSASGRRAIALPASCVAALKRHQRRQTERMLKGAEAWRHDDLVFDRGDGSLLHPNVAYETFRRRAARLGLPVIRFHDLRHTAATLALGRGIHPKVVAERLGHRDVGLTLNRYSHVSMDMQCEAAERIDEALGPDAEDPEGEP